MTPLSAALVVGLLLSGPRPPHPHRHAPDDSAARRHARPPARLQQAPAHRTSRPAPKRAKPGDRVPVVITYYCLKGRTRTDLVTREGIVAADPRVFPLHRHVDVFGRRNRPMGRFLVADTGADIKGERLDVWVRSCSEARRRGKHRGVAVMLTRAESRAERTKERARERAEKQRIASRR